MGDPYGSPTSGNDIGTSDVQVDRTSETVTCVGKRYKALHDLRLKLHQAAAQPSTPIETSSRWKLQLGQRPGRVHRCCAFLIKKLILLTHCVRVEVHQDPRSTLECGATSVEQASKPPDGLPNQGGFMGQTVAQGHFFTCLTHGPIGLGRNTLSMF